jgi:hypothetical protein
LIQFAVWLVFLNSMCRPNCVITSFNSLIVFGLDC